METYNAHQKHETLSVAEASAFRNDILTIIDQKLITLLL